jgi:hypothetical protein
VLYAFIRSVQNQLHVHMRYIYIYLTCFIDNNSPKSTGFVWLHHSEFILWITISFKVAVSYLFFTEQKTNGDNAWVRCGFHSNATGGRCSVTNTAPIFCVSEENTTAVLLIACSSVFRLHAAQGWRRSCRPITAIAGQWRSTRSDPCYVQRNSAL